MQPVAFCSKGGHRISQLETASLCLKCGSFICSTCVAKLKSTNSTNHGSEPCDGKLQTLAEWRAEIIGELIDIRRSLKQTALRPVLINKRWLEVQDFLVSTSQKYLLPQMSHRLFESIVDTDHFILHNLQKFAVEIKKILRMVSIDGNMIKIEDFANVRSLLLRYLSSNVETFDKTVQSWLSESERATAMAEKTRDRIKIMDKFVRWLEGSGIFIQANDELVVNFTPSIVLVTKNSKMKADLLITTERVLFIQPKSNRRASRIILSFDPNEVILCDFKERKRRPFLKIGILRGSEQETFTIHAQDSLLSIINCDLHPLIYSESIKSIKIEPIKAWEIENFQDKISSILFEKLSEMDEKTPITSDEDTLKRNRPVIEYLYAEQELKSKIEADIRLLKDLDCRFNLHKISSQEYLNYRSNIERELQQYQSELERIHNIIQNMRLADH